MRAQGSRVTARLRPRPGAARSRLALRGRRLQLAAFTLIELLTVVLIIGLLITILMPTLTRAKEYAYTAVCGSNLHQLHGYLQVSDSENSVEFVSPAVWRSHVRSLGGEKVLFCPKDRYYEPEITDLDKLYFVQNGKTFCYLPALLAGQHGDSQIQFHKESSKKYVVTYGNAPYYCAVFIIHLGDPVIIEVPDHVSHEEYNGGCSSHHYCCYDANENGHQDWLTADLVIKGKGTVDSVDEAGLGPGTPGKKPLFVGGAGSYAMNAEVGPRSHRPSQILLLGYETGIADPYGSYKSEPDDWDEYLEPATKRHLGKVNVLFFDGRVRGMTREQLEWERDRQEGNWRP